MNRGFWANLLNKAKKDLVVALAPMDGVSDAPFRQMVAEFGGSDFFTTEFTNVEGLCHGNIKGLDAFFYSEIERPVIGQLFGTDTESFYKASLLLLELGFDGIDINMGCPAKKVAEKGAGAGLIRTPKLAREIIKTCKRAVKDWVNGCGLVGFDKNFLDEVARLKKLGKFGGSEGGRPKEKRVEVPVSLKTRIGVDSVVVEEWIKWLIGENEEERPVNISIHGRTLSQMYTGSADWEAIGRAVKIVRESGTGISVFGNGDVQNLEDAKKRKEEFGVNGVLIGRASFGKPWLFSGKEEPSVLKKLDLMFKHAKKFVEIFPDKPFVLMRKHFGWYCKGFVRAKEIRTELMSVSSIKDLEKILRKF